MLRPVIKAPAGLEGKVLDGHAYLNKGLSIVEQDHRSVFNCPQTTTVSLLIGMLYVDVDKVSMEVRVKACPFLPCGLMQVDVIE